MSRLRRHKHRQEAAELNITAFLNLMVVLVPFLLISAVFSQMAILDLNMPDPNKQQQTQKDKQDEEKKERVEVILRSDKIQVSNGQAVALTVEPDESGAYDLSVLTEYLREAKQRQPKKLDATILLEPEIEYERLIQVMDTVKIDVQPQEEGEAKRFELFPVVSIGDAPAVVPAGGAS